MMKKTQIWTLLLLVLSLAFIFLPAQAQDEPAWKLRLRRDWGYGAGPDIQGNMTLYLDGDLSTVKAVVYYLDDQVMAEMTEEPFRFSFNTDDYQPGTRRLSAEVRDNQGSPTRVGPLIYNFLSAADAGSNTITLFVVIGAVTLAAMGISWFISSKQKGSEKEAAGMFGRAVCQQCGKTFPRSIFGMNVVVGKLERCPHCGKWQLTQRASAAQIDLAERQFLTDVTIDSAGEMIEEKTEKEALDDSRFLDM